MVRKRVSRIFAFFMVLAVLVNVSFSFEGWKVQIGSDLKAADNVELTFSDVWNNEIRDLVKASNGDIVSNDCYVAHGTKGDYSLKVSPDAYDSTKMIIKYDIKWITAGVGCDYNYSDILSSHNNKLYINGIGIQDTNSGNSYNFWKCNGQVIVSKSDTIQLLIAGDWSMWGYIGPGARAVYMGGKNSYSKSFDINTTPTILAETPCQNKILSESNKCIPSIKVADPFGDTLTCKYYIDSVEKESKTISNTATAQVVNFSTLDTSTLSEGKHTLKFEVSDGTAAPVSQTVDVIVDKSAPNITAFNIKPDVQSLDISVSASDSISGLRDKPYKYCINDSSSEWISENTYPKNGLIPNTKYKVAVEATDSGDNSAKQEKCVYTIPQTPQVSASNIKENAIDINLVDSNPDPIKYQIKVDSSYVNATGELTSSPDWITPTGKKITVTGLSPSTQYNIQAKAKNGAENDGAENCGAESGLSGITATTLAQSPANIAAEKSINSIKVSWNAVSSATGYDIEADGKAIDAGTATAYTHSGLQAETTHSYRVRTRNLAGTGLWSEYINATTLPNPPDTPAITNTETTYSAITISWDAVAKATSYEIEADGKTIDAGSGTTYTDGGLQPDTSHKYRIRAKNTGGASAWSAYTETGTLPLPPEIPSNLKGVPSKNNITLTWSAADRAEGYELEIDGVTEKLEKVTQYKHGNLTANSLHAYRIRAFNRGGRSSWSGRQTITTWPEIPTAPANIMATSEKDSITVTWYSSPFADSYDVQVDGNNTINVKELSYTQNGLTPGTKHSFRLRAKNISGDGQWSSPVEISTLPEETAPTSGTAGLTNIAAVVTNKTITIAWQAAKANVQYQIEADGKIFDNGKDTVYNHTGLKSQSFHTYRVRTVDADGNGQWCAILALSTLPDLPGAPANLNASASDNQIELSWTKEDGISYEVEADGEVLIAGEAAGYINSGLKPGTSHSYRVRGRNITGFTAWSDSVIKSTTSPSYEVDCKKDKAFNFSLLASNVDYFGGMTFVVTYNPEQLEVQDLCELTADNETSSGKIPGTNLIVTYIPGKIVFSVDESVAPGTNWSGEISTIVFKSKIDGKAGINYSVE